MKSGFIKKLAIAIAALYSPLALAATYEYSVGPGNFGNGGSYDSIYSQYNTNTGVLTWEVDNARKGGDLMDGFWLVLNDGPDNPKGNDGLAIFYADFVDSDGAGTNDNIGLWAYEYNGQNNPNSYLQTDYLGDLTAGLVDNGTTRGFSVDVSGIYSQISSLYPYDDMVGIWFHPNWGAETQVDNQGRIVSWDYTTQSWYDTAGKDTTIVSEPSSIMIFGLGLLGLTLSRRRKA